MADETVFQMFLQAITEYVFNRTGKNVNEDLQVISQLEEILRTLAKERSGQPSEGDQGISQVEDMIRYLISEAMGSYALLTAQNAFLSSEAEKMNETNPSRQMLGELQPVIDRVKFYIDRTNQAKKAVVDLYGVITDSLKMVGSQLCAF